jgi:hypothetical protein
MATYNRIGKKYNLYRRGDERIIHTLIDLLGLPKKSFILDVGAGTGNYSLGLCERGIQRLGLRAFHRHDGTSAASPSAELCPGLRGGDTFS